MILNRTGAEFEYEGVTYTIGGAIVGTAESEYAGLYGRINAIHDGEDKETENETPDIYCEFDPPVMPHEVKALEDTFSDLYHQPKTIADIVLDMVIMAPEMIRPLDDLRSMPKTLYYQNKFLHYMKRYLSMLYREKNYLRVQELSMDLLSIDMYESEVHYYLIKAMLMSGSKTLSQIYFRQAEPYLTDEHMQEVKTLFTSCRT